MKRVRLCWSAVGSGSKEAESFSRQKRCFGRLPLAIMVSGEEKLFRDRGKMWKSALIITQSIWTPVTKVRNGA